MKNMLIFFLTLTTCSFADIVWNNNCQNLSLLQDNAISHQISQNASGYAVAIWSKSEETGSQIQIAYSSDKGNNWSHPQTISEEESAVSSLSPQVVMDNFGHVIATWYSSDISGKQTVKVSYSSDYGASWSSPQNIAIDIPGAPVPQISFDQTGHAVIVFHIGTGEVDSIEACYSSDYGHTWSHQLMISNPSDADDKFFPHVTMDNTGHVIAIWSEGQRIQANSSSDYGVTWNGVVNLSKPPKEWKNFLPQVAMDANGHAVSLWHNGGISPPYTVIGTNSSDYGNSWATPNYFFTPGSYRNNSPQIVLNSSGHAVAIWLQTTTEEYPYISLVQEAHSSDFGSTWSTAQTISFTNKALLLDSDNHQIVMDSVGHVIVEWLNTSDSKLQEIHSSDFGKTWSNVQNIIAAPYISTVSFNLSMDTSGHIISTWLQAISEKNVVRSLTGNFLLDVTVGTQEKIRFLTQIDLTQKYQCTPLYNATIHAYQNRALTEPLGISDNATFTSHQNKQRQNRTLYFTWSSQDGYESDAVEITN